MKKDEDMELAEEHIKLAEDLVVEKIKKSSKDSKKLKDAAFALEKAEADLEEDDEESDE